MGKANKANRIVTSNLNNPTLKLQEHASLSDLTEALANNVQHNSPNHVLTRIATQIEEKKREKGSKLKKLFAWMRMVKNGYLEGIDGDGI